ncbi:hypothetical protein L2E82_03463 [Cichorium intybus]|uniref:Uncharacterized protein n=1 Tax=Cichorium intybus TaxID=13427 RepID=A0ACB9H4I4_CICIN|nr:hypothetical protein L2E82_03463 [Cichorium intybus]
MTAVEINHKIFKVRVKEVDRNIISQEDEDVQNLEENQVEEESSEEEDAIDSSEDESPEGFSDEESEGMFEESIIRYSSPELFSSEGHCLNNGSNNFPVEETKERDTSPSTFCLGLEEVNVCEPIGALTDQFSWRIHMRTVNV